MKKPAVVISSNDRRNLQIHAQELQCEQGRQKDAGRAW